MPDQFHFIQPLWLLALLPLAILLWSLSRHSSTSNPWRKIVDPRLLPLLMGKQGSATSRAPLWLLSGGWLVCVLALANPTWEQQPRPVLQTNTSRVIVLDLSRSMLAADLKPSRLVRARFKVEDILAYDDEGQTGLVVFAGDAFSVTPLTRDADTIRAQLKALDPDIMPSQGSRADLGLLKAQELLQQAGVQSGQVILIADGVEGSKAARAAARLRQSGYRVSVLGVGTTAGAPLPDGQGGVMQDASGKPLLVKLDSRALQSVAQSGGGRYASLSGNETDIKYLLDVAKGTATSHSASDLQTQKWKEQGPLLAVLLLPLAALAFRRGWLLSVVLCAGILTPPQQAMAFGWDDLWQRKDQQAAQALQEGHYDRAAKLAEDPAQRGSAEYKTGDYQRALDAFKNAQGSDAAYNRGNALAKLGKYQDAIAAYDEALKAQPGMEDAVANKTAIEQLLKKQQQQQNRQDSSDQQGEQDKQSNSDNSSSGKGGQSEQKQGANNDTGESPQGEKREPSGNEPASSGSQAASEGDNEKQQDSSDNQFANANRQMNEGETEQRDENEFDTTPAPPLADKDKNEGEVNAAPSGQQNPQSASGQSPAGAEELTSEEQLAAQQWLRRIPDDPGGLLRRKFLYQYRQRAQHPENGNTRNW